MKLKLAHDHLKRVLPERIILSCASMSCSDDYILLSEVLDPVKLCRCDDTLLHTSFYCITCLHFICNARSWREQTLY